MSIHGVDGRNDGSYLANYNAQSKAHSIKIQQAFANTPEGKAHIARKNKEKLHKQNAAKAYASSGEQGLADFYINASPKDASRIEVHTAKEVKAGKTTFADFEKDGYAKHQKLAGTGGVSGEYIPYFDFVDYKSNQGGNSTASKPTPTPTANPSAPTKPEVSTAPVKEDTSGKFPWQKAKEKAQAFKDTSDYVNSWKNDEDPYNMTFNKSNYKFDTNFTPWGKDK